MLDAGVCGQVGEEEEEKEKNGEEKEEGKGKGRTGRTIRAHDNRARSAGSTSLPSYVRLYGPLQLRRGGGGPLRLFDFVHTSGNGDDTRAKEILVSLRSCRVTEGGGRNEASAYQSGGRRHNNR